VYLALIRKEKSSNYGVEFPDFPGCVTAGRTLDEAIRLAPEALALHVRAMIDDGEAIPVPRVLDEVLRDPDSAGGVPTLVRLAPQSGKAVRVNITLDERLLEQVDRFAKAHGDTRSGLLAKAVEAWMHLPATALSGRRT
jgi:predicted RNase H-like HicB family nuclease